MHIQFYTGKKHGDCMVDGIYNYLCNQCLSPLNVVGSNPANVEVYSIQHYVIKFVVDLRQVDGFLHQ